MSLELISGIDSKIVNVDEAKWGPGTSGPIDVGEISKVRGQPLRVLQLGTLPLALKRGGMYPLCPQSSQLTSQCSVV